MRKITCYLAFLIMTLSLVSCYSSCNIARASSDDCEDILLTWGYLKQSEARCDFIFTDAATESSSNACLARDFISGVEPSDLVIMGKQLFNQDAEREGIEQKCDKMRSIVQKTSDNFEDMRK
jgi:hypothetical protein